MVHTHQHENERVVSRAAPHSAYLLPLLHSASRSIARSIPKKINFLRAQLDDFLAAVAASGKHQGGVTAALDDLLCSLARSLNDTLPLLASHPCLRIDFQAFIVSDGSLMHMDLDRCYSSTATTPSTWWEPSSLAHCFGRVLSVVQAAIDRALATLSADAARRVSNREGRPAAPAPSALAPAQSASASSALAPSAHALPRSMPLNAFANDYLLPSLTAAVEKSNHAQEGTRVGTSWTRPFRRWNLGDNWTAVVCVVPKIASTTFFAHTQEITNAEAARMLWGSDPKVRPSLCSQPKLCSRTHATEPVLLLRSSGLILCYP